MHGLSHTLGNTFGKAELAVDVHHPSWWYLRWCQLSWHISLTFTTHLWWWTLISHLVCLCPILSSICLSFAECMDCLTLLERCLAKPNFLLTFVTLYLMISPVTHTSLIFTACLWWWTLIFVFWHMSPILPMPITIFSLSIYCWMRRLSHSLRKAFSKAKLSVDIHHPIAMMSWWCQLSWHISLISQLIYDGEHLDLTHFVYALSISSICLYYLLSVCLLQNAWTVSHSWQDVQ